MSVWKQSRAQLGIGDFVRVLAQPEVYVIVLMLAILVSWLMPPSPTPGMEVRNPCEGAEMVANLSVGTHGTYCAWSCGKTLFYASYRTETPTMHRFRHFCTETGGELLWRP